MNILLSEAIAHEIHCGRRYLRLDQCPVIDVRTPITTSTPIVALELTLNDHRAITITCTRDQATAFAQRLQTAIYRARPTTKTNRDD